MANKYIDKRFYDALVNFGKSDEARDYYYKVMDEMTEKEKKERPEGNCKGDAP